MVGAVERRALDGDAVDGRLDDGVLLGVDGAAELVALAGGDAQLIAQTADVETVSHAARGAVVPGREDALVAHEDGADLAAQTGGAGRRLTGELEEVLVPARPPLRRPPSPDVAEGVGAPLDTSLRGD